jgi:hypothetical protein
MRVEIKVMLLLSTERLYMASDPAMATAKSAMAIMTSINVKPPWRVSCS